MEPLVTIITPTHNHEKFIKKCIESVLKQTYRNWRMVIIDDASEDDTLRIVNKLVSKDIRVKIILHKKNWGIGKLVPTYNQALKYCKTKYVAILEGDDFWPKDKLEKQTEFMENTNSVFSFGDCVITSQSGLPIKLFTYDRNDQNLISNKPLGSVLQLFATLNFSIIPVTVMVRLDELKQIGGFQTDKYYPFADIPTFLKLALIGKFGYQNEILGYYRKQTTSEWFNFASSTTAMGRVELANCINNFMALHKKNRGISRILKMRKIFMNQNKFIKNKVSKKQISLIANKVAFNMKPNPLIAVFGAEYLVYKLKKFYHANRN